MLVIRPYILITIITVIILLIASFIIFYHQIQPKKRILLGAWTTGLVDPKTQKIHPGKLVEFEKLTHKNLGIAHYYLGWESLTNPKIITQFATLRQFGWEPMLNVNPYYFKGCPATSLPLYKAIADGKCDKFLRSAGKNLAKVNKPFYLLFAWEMNNPQNDWSVIHTGSTSKDFVSAWQHMHTIFTQEGAKNIIWVFCPNIPDNQETPYSKLYPGDAYVDAVGLDGYNWGTTQDWSSWVSFEDIFTGPYNKIVRIAPHKPVIIAEVNSTDKGGDKAAWYTDMFQIIPKKFPKISAVVIFNEDKSRQEKVNWQINISPQSLQAFIKGIHLKSYR